MKIFLFFLFVIVFPQNSNAASLERFQSYLRTTQSARQLALRHNVSMPITEQVHKILFEGSAPRASIAALMQRDPKPEKSLPSGPRL